MLASTECPVLLEAWEASWEEGGESGGDEEGV